jgi:hypothetical protein
MHVHDTPRSLFLDLLAAAVDLENTAVGGDIAERATVFPGQETQHNQVKGLSIHRLEQKHSLLGKPKVAALSLEQGIAVDIVPYFLFLRYYMASTCGIRWIIPLDTFDIGHAVAFVQWLAEQLDY